MSWYEALVHLVAKVCGIGSAWQSDKKLHRCLTYRDMACVEDINRGLCDVIEQQCVA